MDFCDRARVAGELLQVGCRAEHAEPAACRRSPDLAPDDYARIDELASLSELRGLLREQIALLDDGQRDALWLRIIEEKPFSDVAEELGITDAAARKRVSRALKILAEVSGKLEASLGGMPYDHA